MNAPNKPTWQELVEIEPRLAHLPAIAARGGCELTWREVKRALVPLVGWHARTNRAVLKTVEAWDCCHGHLRDVFEGATWTQSWDAATGGEPS